MKTTWAVMRMMENEMTLPTEEQTRVSQFQRVCSVKASSHGEISNIGEIAIANACDECTKHAVFATEKRHRCSKYSKGETGIEDSR